MADVAPLRAGDPARVGPYLITGRLGRGGQGTVYQGCRNDDPAARPVAVKLLHPHFTDDPKARARLLREASLASKVARFCTAQVLDFGEDDDRVYLVSEYVTGRSLTDLLDLDGPRTGVALERLAISTVTALAAIHEAGVVHLDFKPANVLMTQDGPIVIDFGIARALDAAASATSGQIVGSPAYMSPEQYNGEEVGPATDMFAWGVTMVHAATGMPAFGLASGPTMMRRILMEEPDLSGLEPPLRDLVAACLSKDAGARPSARDVLLSLIGQTRPDPQPQFPPDTSIPAQAVVADHFSPVTPPSPLSSPASATAPMPPPPPGAPAGGTSPMPPPAPSAPMGATPAVPPPGPSPASATPETPPMGSGLGAGAADVEGRKGGKRLAVIGAVLGVAAVAVVAAVGVPMLTESDHPAAGVTSAGGRGTNGGGGGPATAAGGATTAAGAQAGGTAPPASNASPTPTPRTSDSKPPAEPSKKYVPAPGPSAAGKPIPWTLKQICGSGMAVVDSHSLGKATVYLMYDNSSGYNCVTTTVQTSTGSTAMSSVLQRQGGSAVSDSGDYAFYAGPVKVSARGTCVKWGGSYDGQSWMSGWSHCG